MKLKISNLTKKYNDKTVIDNVSLNVDNVKSVGVIGGSGSGKSTLLRLMSGLEPADSGAIEIDGVELTKSNIKEFQDKIGFVFQKHNLFPHLTVYDNLMLILNKVKGVDKLVAKNKVDELLSILHLSEHKDKKPSQLSGGQAQRVSIARAISTNSSLVLLDEPTSALDPILTNEVLHAITTLKDSGKDFVFVTHEISFLRKFADYIVFLDEGRVVECGSKEILKNPQTAKLSEFLKAVEY